MIVLYRQGRGRYNYNNLNLPPSQIDASYRSTQQYNHPSSRTRFISSFIEVYTYFIMYSALLDQWKLLGVFSICHSWMAESRLTTSCNEDGSIQTYSLPMPTLFISHQDNVLLELQIYELGKEGNLTTYLLLPQHTCLIHNISPWIFTLCRVIFILFSWTRTNLTN